MRRPFCFFAAAFSLLAVLHVPAAPAQDWAKAALAKSSRHGEYVTIPEAGGRKLQAWVVYPEVKDKAPVIVLIHEIFGLSDWAREMADELAGAGYIVVAPDLLSGFGPAPAPAQALGAHGGNVAAEHGTCGSADGCMMGMDHGPMLERVAAQAPGDHPPMGQNAPGGPQGAPFVPADPGGVSAFPDQGAVTRAVSSLDPAIVNTDLDAAADYGKHLPASSGKLFVTGFCWGGGKSFLFATHRKDLSAAFVFYGPPPPADAMKNINAPVYGFYAGNDARIGATIPQTKIDMKAAGKTYEVVIYDGAGHGFMRGGEAPDASAENSAARAGAFRRLVQLLGGVR